VEAGFVHARQPATEPGAAHLRLRAGIEQPCGLASGSPWGQRLAVVGVGPEAAGGRSALITIAVLFILGKRVNSCRSRIKWELSMSDAGPQEELLLTLLSAINNEADPDVQSTRAWYMPFRGDPIAVSAINECVNQISFAVNGISFKTSKKKPNDLLKKMVYYRTEIHKTVKESCENGIEFLQKNIPNKEQKTVSQNFPHRQDFIKKLKATYPLTVTTKFFEIALP